MRTSWGGDVLEAHRTRTSRSVKIPSLPWITVFRWPASKSRPKDGRRRRMACIAPTSRNEPNAFVNVPRDSETFISTSTLSPPWSGTRQSLSLNGNATSEALSSLPR
eukprot:TRINITY_DN4683_c0_g1::TRINITY_DN4683_c0_g1_i1::g.19659::m.19659 TRINITY_DN4683_c0_g1::TRINITY_DN4683_c0_g1_i1::g.19659  ORF type:complete len:107 (-),score=-17.85,TOH_N/PF12549.3/3.3e+03,TOH_N/PF12549.3/0.049 TRINITY_DN4683_c0_g1_i1:251-571(-)